MACVVVAGALASGCNHTYFRFHECYTIVSRPVVAAVKIVGAPRQAGLNVIRPEASVWLFEGGGVLLNTWAPHGVFWRSIRLYECETPADEDFAEWLEAAQRLAARLGARINEQREVLIVRVSNEEETAWPAAFVADLDTAKLDAAGQFFCLAYRSFGDDAERAIVDVAPVLVARIDFPTVC